MQTAHWHTSTHRHEDPVGATEKVLNEQFEKYKDMFELTSDRLKAIVERFVGVLETGLEQPGQTVVSRSSMQHVRGGPTETPHND